MDDLIKLARNETERRILKKMEKMGFPGSVKTTVFVTVQIAPESAMELEALLDNGATPREMAKAVQPIIKETEKAK